MVMGGHGEHHGAAHPLFVRRRHPLADLVKMRWITQNGSTTSCSAPATAAPRSSACSRRDRPITRPPLAALEMAESLSQDQKRVLPCAAYLDGEYGVKGMYAGVPMIIGAKGVERVIELDSLRPRRSLHDSVGSVGAGRIVSADRADPRHRLTPQLDRERRAERRDCR